MAEIKDVATEYNDMLSGFASNINIDKGPVVVDPTTNAAPTGGEAIIDPLTGQPEPTAQSAEPVVEVPVVVAVEKKDSETPSVFDDWDVTVPNAAPVAKPVEAAAPAPSLIFEDLGKALGVEIKSQDDLVKAYQAERVKAQAMETIPAELKKAIELASKGADYLEYLKVNTVDYSTADPVELYENYIIDSSADDKGQVDEEKINEYLDSLPAFEKELRGKDLQRRLISEQNRRTVEIEQEAVRNRQKHDMELQSALRSFAEIDGFKVNDNHRKELFDWVSSGKIMKDLFYNGDGQFDAVKAAQVAFRNKYYDKLDAYHKTKIRNSTKREILEEITNQEIVTTPKSTNAQPRKDYGISDVISLYEQQMSQR